ncbi:phytanoyl-CoA dioxygenase family protein [Hyalangium versicolor]|uniref:phytanoyl-CoA dioxygenase family protein n=1 Tax=Hyalangium versicolor TaxID=2861190 RepID=UPI001CCD775E|nr:phytanoyl-CoA dioxygenase family protein [Hyalangium versicolor]
MTALITVSPEEFSQGAFTPESLNQALALYNASGYLAIDNALDVDFIRQLRESYQAAYGHLTEEEIEKTNLNVGDHRFMISPAIKPPFFDPRLYANAFVMPLLEKLLEPGFLINSLTCVTSYPGAKEQHLHADHPPLFPQKTLGASLDPYAITVAIPLLDLDEKTGTTAMLPGTHAHVALADIKHDRARHELPYGRMGSCYFMDYRLWHYGTANVSEHPRPIVYIVYSRSWFVDATNFAKQPPVKIHPSEMVRIPPQHFGLFKRVLQNTSNTMALAS